MKFITFFSVRPATERILKLWSPLQLYFAEVSKKLDKDQSKIEKKIIPLLQSTTIKAELHFVNYVASSVESVLTFLERNDQIIFQADDGYKELLQKLTAMVLMPGSGEYESVVSNHGFATDVEYKFEVTLPQEVNENIPPADDENFRRTAVKFVKDLVNYLNKKMFFHPFLFDVKHSAPNYIFKEGSIKRILETASNFGQVSNTKLFEELTLFVLAKNQETSKTSINSTWPLKQAESRRSSLNCSALSPLCRFLTLRLNATFQDRN